MGDHLEVELLFDQSWRPTSAVDYQSGYTRIPIVEDQLRVQPESLKLDSGTEAVPIAPGIRNHIQQQSGPGPGPRCARPPTESFRAWPAIHSA